MTAQLLDTTSATAGVISLTSGTVTPAQGTLVVIAVGLLDAGSANKQVSSVSHTVPGLGTFSRVVQRSDYYATPNLSVAVDLWAAVQSGSSGAGGTITANLSEGMDYAAMHTVQLSNVKLDPGAARTFTGTVDGNSLAIPLSPAVQPNELALGCVMSQSAGGGTSAGITPGTGWTELGDIALDSWKASQTQFTTNAGVGQCDWSSLAGVNTGACAIFPPPSGALLAGVV